MRALPDPRLDDWLIQHDIGVAVRNIIHGEDFSFEDFVYGMEQDDLRRIGLRVGTEVKLWRAIQAYRSQQPLSPSEPAPSPSSSSLSTVLMANGSFDEPPQLRQHHQHQHQHHHHHKPISNSNSWDSSHSAGTATSSEYESCNGGEGS